MRAFDGLGAGPRASHVKGVLSLGPYNHEVRVSWELELTLAREIAKVRNRVRYESLANLRDGTWRTGEWALESG